MLRSGKQADRDTNFNEYLTSPDTQRKIARVLRAWWENKIKDAFLGSSSYVVDVLLTRSLEAANVVDFNPYAPRTDALLFTYPELREIFRRHSCDQDPDLRVIDSAGHPSASRNTPINQHNMVPREALELSQGRTMEEFSETWMEQIRTAAETQAP